MARRCVFAELVYPLFLIVLLRGCGSDSLCPNEGHLIVDTGRGQILTSPNYPGSYGYNQNCSWKITADSVQDAVYVYVISLDLEGGTSLGCPYDSLSIYDSDGLTRRLAKLCGSDVRTKAFQSTGRHMYLKFVSDHTLSKSGFVLQISAVQLGGSDRIPNAPFLIGAKEQWVVKANLHHMSYLSSPGYPDGSYSDQNISWSILCDHSYVVQLHIVEMDLDSSRRCRRNRVTVYDTDKSLLATMCNVQFEGVDMYSSGSAMFVHFTSGFYQIGKRFSLGYQAVWPYEAKPWDTKSPPGSSDRGPRIKYDILIIVLGAGGFFVTSCCVVVVACYRKRRSSRPSVGRPATSTSSTTRLNNNNDRAVCIVPRQHTRPAVPRPLILPAIPPPRAQAHTNPAFSPHSEGPPSISRAHAHTNPAFSSYSEGPPSFSRAQAHTNPTFSPHSEGPPSFSRAQTHTNPTFSPYSEGPPPYSSLNATTVQVETEDPPPYRESMVMTHPSSYNDVSEETPAQSVTV